ncbi:MULTISPECIES: hypothetical protein [unclassified Mycobacterium]|uniref:hypothetical protein n=1 Tax=unclassified Mycobacterium TaxID=2642494 RepID=UPI0029C79D27|nr:MULTISPECIES: hypothetical protein [unclassified Mycobacterium]
MSRRLVHNAASTANVPICGASNEDYERLVFLHAWATFIGFREAARSVRDGGG